MQIKNINFFNKNINLKLIKHILIINHQMKQEKVIKLSYLILQTKHQNYKKAYIRKMYKYQH